MTESDGQDGSQLSESVAIHMFCENIITNTSMGVKKQMIYNWWFYGPWRRAEILNGLFLWLL